MPIKKSPPKRALNLCLGLAGPSSLDDEIHDMTNIDLGWINRARGHISLLTRGAIEMNVRGVVGKIEEDAVGK